MCTKVPPDGYLQIRLLFDPLVVGQPGTLDTIVIVCSLSPESTKSFLIMVMNMNLVRWLLTPIATESTPCCGQCTSGSSRKSWSRGCGKNMVAGENRESTTTMRRNLPLSFCEVELGPAGSNYCLKSWKNFGIKLISENFLLTLQKAQGRVSISVCNITDSPGKLWAQMLPKHVNPATSISPSFLVGGSLSSQEA